MSHKTLSLRARIIMYEGWQQHTVCAKTLQLRGNKNSWPGRCVSEAIKTDLLAWAACKMALWLLDPKACYF